MEDEKTVEPATEAKWDRDKVTEALRESGVIAGADLSEIDLSHFDFVAHAADAVPKLFGLQLKGADLTGAKLRGAIIGGVNLTEAKLDEADLQGAKLGGVNLAGSSLRNADLQVTRVIGANAADCDFTGANLRDSVWMNSNVSGADFSDVLTGGARAAGVPWRSADVPPLHPPQSLVQVPKWLPALLLGIVVVIVLSRLRRKGDA